MFSRGFILDMSKSRGSSARWIAKIIYSGSVGVRVNDMNSEKFLAGRGVRQGDPISPLIFNLVDNVFIRMLVKESSKNLISRLHPVSNHAGVISMQYADDTLLRIYIMPKISNGSYLALSIFLA